MTLQFSSILATSILLLTLLACKTTEEFGSELLDSNTAPQKRRVLKNFTCPTNGPVKVAFFDADSTLRISRSGSPSANGPEDVYLLPFVAQKIAELNQQGYLVAIASNQGGVPKFIEFDEAQAALVFTATLIAKAGGSVNYIDFASKPDGASMRKPQVGMGTKLEEILSQSCPGAKVDKASSIFVGDAGYKRGEDGPHPDGRIADDFSNSDRGFAENYGIKFVEPNEFFGWREFGVFNFHKPHELRSFVSALEAEAKDLKLRGKNEERQKRLESMAETMGQANPFPESLIYVHYNIRELKTSQLIALEDRQVNSAAETIEFFNPDFISINEMQYDKPDIPSGGIPGTGQNLHRLLDRANLDSADWQVNFAEALTGRDAQKNQSGEYESNPNSFEGRKLGDQVNFGVFPGEYSTAFGVRHFPIAKKIVHPVVPADVNISIDDSEKVRWIDWDKGSNPGQFAKPSGESLPNDMELFDKNFNHTTVEISGKEIHFVTFHTVPAFDFGNPKAPNVARNAAQLDFLKWYLTGKCDPSDQKSKVKRCDTKVRPLLDFDPDPRFIAVGDLNVDIDSDKPGAKILQELIFESKKLHSYSPVFYDTAGEKNEETHISHISYINKGTDFGKLQERLDYFLVSKNLQLDAAFSYAPKSYFKQGECFEQRAVAENELKGFQNQVPNLIAALSRRFGEPKEWCHVAVSRVFARYREGSDHLPVVLKFRP